METALYITAEGHCTELFLGRDDLSTVMLTDQYIFPLSHVKICSAATTKTILVRVKGDANFFLTLIRAAIKKCIEWRL